MAPNSFQSPNRGPRQPPTSLSMLALAVLPSITSCSKEQDPIHYIEGGAGSLGSLYFVQRWVTATELGSAGTVLDVSADYRTHPRQPEYELLLDACCWTHDSFKKSYFSDLDRSKSLALLQRELLEALSREEFQTHNTELAALHLALVNFREALKIKSIHEIRDMNPSPFSAFIANLEISIAKLSDPTKI